MDSTTHNGKEYTAQEDSKGVITLTPVVEEKKRYFRNLYNYVYQGKFTLATGKLFDSEQQALGDVGRADGKSSDYIFIGVIEVTDGDEPSVMSYFNKAY